MGNTPGEDYEEGVGCDHCFGEAAMARLGVGHLIYPEWVNFNLSGIIACPFNRPATNGVFLAQSVFACYWAYGDAEWTMHCLSGWAAPDVWKSAFWVQNLLEGKNYFYDENADCSYSYSNDNTILDCGVVKGGYDGTCEVTWGPGIGP